MKEVGKTRSKKIPPKIKRVDTGDLNLKHQDGKFWKDYWEAAEESLKIPSPYSHPSAAEKYVILMSSSGSFCKSHICPCAWLWRDDFSFSFAFKFQSSSSHQQTLNLNQTETGVLGNVQPVFCSDSRRRKWSCWPDIQLRLTE